MKVAHVTTVPQSLSLLLLNQMLSLREAGFDVTGISSPGLEVATLHAAGIPHLAIPMHRTISPLADLRSLWQLVRTLRRERFTIVHTHTPKAGLLGQLAARLAGVPIIVNTIHGFYFHEHMRRRAQLFYIAMEKVAAACSHLILTQNAEDLRTAIRERICRERNIKLLGNGIDLSLFQAGRDAAADRAALGLAQDAPVIGFVGRLAARRKGFLDFLAMARTVAAELPAARFLIAGEADLGKPDAVEPSVAAGFGIADRCLFVGNLRNDLLPAIYSAMDVLVLPSLFEGIPRVVMEASAMGRPSVVSDVKGNREAVEEGRNGFRVPFGDVPALAAAVLRILRDPALAAELRRQSLDLARERFDERQVFATVRREYARLLREKGLTPA